MISGSVACKKDDSTSSMPMSQIYPYTKKIYASIICYNQLGKEERFGGLWQTQDSNNICKYSYSVLLEQTYSLNCTLTADRTTAALAWDNLGVTRSQMLQKKQRIIKLNISTNISTNFSLKEIAKLF